MADRLTQLQDCYDQLATQFYACIRYISIHHRSSPLTPSSSHHTLPGSHNLPNQTTTNNTNTNSNTNNNTTNNNTNDANTTHEQPPDQPNQTASASYPSEQRPDSPTTFSSAQRELAQDLLLKTKQIDYLISVLPGVENSQEKQEGRIGELDAELREALEERKQAEEERQLWLDKIDGIIGGIRR